MAIKVSFSDIRDIGQDLRYWLYKRWRKTDAPIIHTPFGPVTEFARQTAAMNMKADPDLKRQVEEMLAKELGSAGRGLAEAKRRYPEAYQ